MPYTKHATIRTPGRILGTSLTGSFQQLIAAQYDVGIIQFFNSTDTEIVVSLDGGTTIHYYLEGEGFVIDLRSSDLQLTKPDIQVKHNGVIPTQGSVRCTLLEL